jgi:N-succinyldiaminopimelate aminotransferase
MVTAPTTIFTRMTALAEETGAVNLGQGFPDFDGPAAIIEAAVGALRSGHNQYAPLSGIPTLRRAIAGHQLRRYGIELDPEREIQVTFGATEALAAAILGLVAPGDEVAFLDPAYDSYPAIVGMAGGGCRPIMLEPPDWRVDAAAVAAAIGPATRVLLVNSPHNPTGRVLDADELELLAAACREHDVIAVTDEVYEHLVFDGTHIPLARLPGMAERTVSVSSIGKSYAVTGWKVGWAAVRRI